MAESAEEVHARTVEAGPLSAPDLVGWDVFPWVVRDGAIAPKELSAPAAEEPRLGDDPSQCPLCEPDPQSVIWSDDRWRVKRIGQQGIPVAVILEPLEHADLADLGEDMAAELGQWSVRLARIVERLPHVARCHINRWGDGAAHLHVWFLGRTAGLSSTRGTFASQWAAFLPPGPEDVWRADLSAIAAGLASYGGRSHV